MKCNNIFREGGRRPPFSIQLPTLRQFFLYYSTFPFSFKSFPGGNLRFFYSLL